MPLKRRYVYFNGRCPLVRRIFLKGTYASWIVNSVKATGHNIPWRREEPERYPGNVFVMHTTYASLNVRWRRYDYCRRTQWFFTFAFVVLKSTYLSFKWFVHRKMWRYLFSWFYSFRIILLIDLFNFIRIFILIEYLLFIMIKNCSARKFQK